MAPKKVKTAEELEQQFELDIGMGDRFARFLVWTQSLFDGGESKICLATLHGRAEEVERLLFHQPELLNATWNRGPHSSMSLLHCAVSAFKNRELTVEVLLKKGHSVKTTDGEGATPMEYLLQDNRGTATRRLIEMLRSHGAF